MKQAESDVLVIFVNLRFYHPGAIASSAGIVQFLVLAFIKIRRDRVIGFIFLI